VSGLNPLPAPAGINLTGKTMADPVRNIKFKESAALAESSFHAPYITQFALSGKKILIAASTTRPQRLKWGNLCTSL